MSRERSKIYIVSYSGRRGQLEYIKVNKRLKLPLNLTHSTFKGKPNTMLVLVPAHYHNLKCLLSDFLADKFRGGAMLLLHFLHLLLKTLPLASFRFGGCSQNI